jgi:hypothetical protein
MPFLCSRVPKKPVLQFARAESVNRIFEEKLQLYAAGGGLPAAVCSSIFSAGIFEEKSC